MLQPIIRLEVSEPIPNKDEVRQFFLEHLGTDELVRIDTVSDETFAGFVTTVSTDLVMIQEIIDNNLTQNGYSVFRIDFCKTADLYDTFLFEAVRLLDLKPQTPRGIFGEISIDSWPSLLESLKGSFWMLLLEMGVKEPDSLYIGQVQNFDSESLHLHEVDTHAEWEEVTEYCYEDITRIAFGDGYVHGLELVVASKMRPPGAAAPM